MRQVLAGRGLVGVLSRVIMALVIAWPLVTAPVVTGAAREPRPLGTGKATTRAIAVTRVLPSTTVTAGQTFQVTANFTAPANLFNAIGYSDFVPTGWTITANKVWCEPDADQSKLTGNRVDYVWYGPDNPDGSVGYTQGTRLDVLYEVTVPSSATPGVYTVNGFLEYYLGTFGPFTDNVSGATTVTVRAALPPQVTTDAASSITNTSATLNGNVTTLGESTNVTRSFQWGLTDNYTAETTPSTTNATGAFSAALTSLLPYTTYHFRARAVGSTGTAYGIDRTFTTTGTAPTVTTDAPTSVNVTAATLNGTLSDLGSAPAVQVLFDWALQGGAYSRGSTSPVTVNATGPFSVALTGLEPGTGYQFRARAVGHGTTNGSDRTFSTSAGVVPTVTTDNATAITNTSATLSGTLVSIGSSTNATVSFQWGLSENYTSETTPTTLTSGAVFTFNLTSLLPYTTYHFRAKGVGHGTGYGVDRTFSTTGTPPAVTTDNATNVGLTSATLNGTLNSLGSATSALVFFDWGTTDQYSRGTTTPVTVNATGPFNANLAGLLPNTTYHFRARSVAHGVGVGLDGQFTTLSTPPVVVTDNATDVRTTSAVLNATLGSLGSATGVQVSFEWGQTVQYTGGTTAPTTLSAPGPFSFNLTGLSTNTTYHYRAKAVGHGTAYGADRVFTTPPINVIRDLPASVIRGDTFQVTATFTAPANLFNAIGFSDFVPASLNITAEKTWNTPAADQSKLTGNRIDYVWYGPDNPDGSVGYPQSTAFTVVYRVTVPAGTAPGLYTFGGQLEYYLGTTGPFVANVAGDHAIDVLAISPPTVTTDAATNITNTSATLNATMSSLGTATNVTVSFQWGLTDNYTFETTPVTTNRTGALSANITGLSPYVTYHFRIKGVGDLTGYAACRTFTTTSTPPTVTTEAATSVANTSATLNGNLGGLGTATNVTVSFQWGLSENYTGETTPTSLTNPGAFTFNLAGLEPFTTYHFRAKAVGHGTVYGIDRTFTTTSAAPAVTTGSATNVTATSAVLNLNLGSLGTARNVQVSFDWGLTTAYGANTGPVTTNATGAFSAVLAGLQPSKTYYFRAVAVGHGTTYGAVQSLTTPTILLGVTVTPDRPTIAEGRARQMTATGAYSDNTTKNITALSGTVWATSDNTVATVSTTGRVTAIKIGTTTISATLDGLTGTTLVTVADKEPELVTVNPPNPSVAKGRTQQFVATVTYSEGSTANVTAVWTSSAPTIASIEANTGLARALLVGTTTITATHSGLTGSTLLRVTPAELVSLAISPANHRVPKGRIVQFSAIGTYTDNTTDNITTSVDWTSDNISRVAIGLRTGLARTLEEGQVTIRAAQGTVSNTTTFTVDPKVLDAIAVTPENASKPLGRNQQFTATGTYSDNSTEDITSSAGIAWASSDPAKATIAAGTGLATTRQVGRTFITAVKSGIASNQATLIVTTPELDSIAVTPGTANVALGLNQQFTAAGTYSDNTTGDITSVVSWTSSNTTVAHVTSMGLARSRAVGTTNITAAMSGKSRSAVLSVGDATVSSLEIVPDNPAIAKGNSIQFSAFAHKTDGSREDQTGASTWASSDNAVATISTTGLALGAGTGTTNITARNGGNTDWTILTVGPPTLDSIAIREAAPSLAAGRQLQLHVDGRLSDNNTTDLTSVSVWASLNRAIATVSTNGTVSGVAAGSANITASNGGFRTWVSVNVGTAELDTVTVTPPNPTIPVGDTVQFMATGTYSDNSSRPLTTVTWGTSDNTVATASAGGLATALKAGTTTITATSGTKSGNTLLTVAGATLRSIAIATDNLTVPAGRTRQFTATGTYSDNTTRVITTMATWASSDTARATIGANTGLATGVAVGTPAITARVATAAGTITSNSATLNVIAAELVSLSLTSASPSIPAGRTLQYTATGSYSNGTTSPVTSSVTWATSDNTVATISTAGEARGLRIGTTNITATQGAISRITLLTVTAPVLVSLAVSPSSATINAGRTQQFTATGTYSDGSTRNLSNDVTWTSSNAVVASLDNTGLATSYSAGIVTITATLGTAVATSTVTVNAAVLDTVTISPFEPTIPKGTSQQFRAMGQYSDGSRRDITIGSAWTSLNTGIATVSSAGLATSPTTGSTGTTNITVTRDTKSATTALRVTDARLDSIAVTTDNLSVPAGRARQFTAIGTYSDNATSNVTAQVAWASTTPAVARINVGGLATTFAPGTTLIMATLSGIISPPVTLTVGASELDSLVVTPLDPDVTFVSGAPPTVQFTATAIYSDGRSEIVTNLSAWTSSSGAVATVNPASGLATTVGAGTTNIAAVYLGKTNSTVLRVRPDTVAPVVTMTSPTEGLVIRDKNLSVAGNVNDLSATTTVIVNDAALPGVLVLDGSGNFSRGILLNAGSNTVMVRAEDGSRNVGTSATVNVIVNPNKPNVTITRPSDRYMTNVAALEVRGTVTDNVTNVLLRLNGVATNVTATGGDFATTVTLAEGTNILVANAYAPGHDLDEDYLGTSGTKTVILDTTPPVITITSPAAGSVVSTSGILVSGTTDDPGVAIALLILNGGIPQPVPVSGGSFSQSATLVPGDNTIVMVTTDRVGNTASSGTVGVILDNTRPAVTVTAPPNRLVTNAASQTVTGLIGEPAITSGTIYVNGSGQTFSVAPDGTFRHTVTLAAGANTIEVRVQDLATPPNVGSSGNITVTVDTTAPELTLGLSEPTDSITIMVTSDEPLSAVPAVVVEPTSRQTPVTMTRVDVNRWVGTYGSATSPIAAGAYNITITGIDRAGNRTVKTATFTKTTINVDGVNPTSVQTSSTTVNVETNGAVNNANVSVTQHMENPSGLVDHPEGAGTTAGAFVEINASADLRNNLKQVYIRVNYNRAELPAGTDEYSLRLYLWDVTEGIWKVVPDSGVNVPETYIYGTATHLSKFGGFGAAARAAAPPGGGGGGPNVIAIPLTGFTATNLRIDENGVAQTTVRLQTPDNKVALDVSIGTRLLEATGKAIKTLSVSPVAAPPAPPSQQAVVAAYDFGPSGATFYPALTMTLAYDPATLPKGAKESDLYVAFWDGSKWTAVEGTLDTASRTISAKVTHFSQFAILGRLPPPEPAKFAISKLAVAPAQVKPDETVTVIATVSNSGGTEGKYTVVLKVNNTEEARKDITLGAGKTDTVSFTVKKTAAGKYAVDVNGTKGEFTVAAPPPPPPPKPPVPAVPKVAPAPTTVAPPVAPPPTPAPAPAPGPNWLLIAVVIAVVVSGVVWLVFARRKAKQV